MFNDTTFNLNNEKIYKIESIKIIVRNTILVSPHL